MAGGGTSSSSATAASPGVGAASSSAASPLLSSSTPIHSTNHGSHAGAEPSPTDLLLSTPPQVLKFLTLSAPLIHALAHLAELVSWQKGKFYESSLVLLAWWGICLFGELVMRYALPGVIVLGLFATYLRNASTRRGTSSTTSMSSSTSRRSTTSSSAYQPATLTPASYLALLNSFTLLASTSHQLRLSLLQPLKAHYLSFTPLRHQRHSPAYTTSLTLISLWPAYILLTFFVPLRLIFLFVGSVGILWHAPFFDTLRTSLWRSAAVRWLVRLVGGLVTGLLSGQQRSQVKKEWGRTGSGVGVPGFIGDFLNRGHGTARAKRADSTASNSSTVVELNAAGQKKDGRGSEVAVPSGAEGASAANGAAAGGEAGVQVTFTVFENQRWWVGLDWTHALLPGERASWTDPALHPTNPPSSFLLPPPSVSYTPSPTPSDPSSRLKRTTEWKWIEAEWRVMRGTGAGAATAGTTPTASVSMSANWDPRSEKEKKEGVETKPPSPIVAAVGEADAMLGDVDGETVDDKEKAARAIPQSAVGDDEGFFANWSVDAEGWQYGDNHFERLGPRGGLGKYTRRRAWVRRAGLFERIERVSGSGGLGTAGGVGIGIGGGAISVSSPSRGKERSGSAGAGGGSGSGSGSGSRERRREREKDKDKDKDRGREASGGSSALSEGASAARKRRSGSSTATVTAA